MIYVIALHLVSGRQPLAAQRSHPLPNPRPTIRSESAYSEIGHHFTACPHYIHALTAGARQETTANVAVADQAMLEDVRSHVLHLAEHSDFLLLAWNEQLITILVAQNLVTAVAAIARL